ncbi:MAG TPA: TonB-dependent receptor plug domain-containing protein, partial [Povalibacter sp.]|nr:TonB-dependent receptor plug domain-containing protein [Povalibacter sp.]
MRRAVQGGALTAVALGLVPIGSQAQNAPRQSVGLEEIVVTATRRSESVQDIPVSVVAFGKQQMDVQGVKAIDDIARLSPSVQFSRGGGFGSDLGNAISIRGMGAVAGPATTAVYIDDTPTQVGATIASGSFTDNAYPMLFDIDRVEVLSGPQGTLFGSGSEGGAVRFIQSAPNMSDSSMYSRTEASATTYGAPSYEAGIAGGAPIIQDKLGFRASVWTRHTGGYVDLASPYTGQVLNSNNNYQDAISARLALGWQVTDGLMVTPSFYYQRIKSNGAGSFYFPSDDVGKNPVMVPGPFGPTPDSVWINQPYGDPQNGKYVDLHQLNQPATQTMKLSAVKVEWALPNDMELFSNTSYYERDQKGTTDFAPLEVAFWDGTSIWPADPTWLFPGHDKQGNEFFTQEVRLQSTNDDARLK